MTAAMQNKVLTQNLKDVRHKLFVMSGKGGVGKSSVTVNLATALASRGFTVGILDVDIHGPSVPRLLGASASVMADENGKMLPVPCGERMKFTKLTIAFLSVFFCLVVACGSDGINDDPKTPDVTEPVTPNEPDEPDNPSVVKVPTLQKNVQDEWKIDSIDDGFIYYNYERYDVIPL